MNNVSISIFGLAKNNNGQFKSEAQAKFLTSKMDEVDGYVGSVTSGYNSCPVFAEYDSEGIIKLTKSTKKGHVVMFDRKVEGVLTTLEVKEIKRLTRLGKNLKIEIDGRTESFATGKYNGSGDPSTYTEDMIARFNMFQDQKTEQLKSINTRLDKLNEH